MDVSSNSIIKKFDPRRQIVVLGTAHETVEFAFFQFVQLAQNAINERGAFYVALSGGTTPNAIFKRLSESPQVLDWSKVYLFWSDERAVSPHDPESNYRTAMQSGLNRLPAPVDHIFRMKAEPRLNTEDPALNIEEKAAEYQNDIFRHIPKGIFDLVMLGMGEDGHTASLFPHTLALQADRSKWVVANFVTQKKCWRMTLSFEAINSARQIVIYVMGESKAEMVNKALKGHYEPEHLPVQRVGTAEHPALWVMDKAAARLL